MRVFDAQYAYVPVHVAQMHDLQLGDVVDGEGVVDHVGEHSFCTLRHGGWTHTGRLHWPEEGLHVLRPMHCVVDPAYDGVYRLRPLSDAERARLVERPKVSTPPEFIG